MRSSRIKKNSGRSGIDIKRTEHDFWFHKRRLCRHMIHLSCVGCWLLMTILPLGGLLVWLLGVVIRHVTLFTIEKTLVGGISGTSLQWIVVGCSLACCLLAALLLILLALLELITLRVLTMIQLTGWPLVPLLESLLRAGVWMSVASRGLSLKPLLLGLHFLALIVNHNSAIHECLEVGVCIGHKLELETIIQTLK